MWGFCVFHRFAFCGFPSWSLCGADCCTSTSSRFSSNVSWKRKKAIVKTDEVTLLSHLWTVAPETAFPIALRTAPNLVRIQGSLCRKGKRGTCLQAALQWLHVTKYNLLSWKNEGFLISTETWERPLAHLNPLCFCPIWALQSTACMLLRDWLSGSYFWRLLEVTWGGHRRLTSVTTSMLCSSRAPLAVSDFLQRTKIAVWAENQR